MLLSKRINLPSFLLLTVVWACTPSQPQTYEIDKPSPGGSYRVKVHVRRGQGGSLDEARFQFLKGQEVVETWDWKQPDQYEPDFDSLLPIEWLNDQVVVISAKPVKARFADELIVTNNSGENVKHMSIAYGRAGSYWIFDLAPGKQITIRAHPWFTVKGDEFRFGYGGITQTGKSFVAVINAGERLSPGEPKKFSVTISPELLAKSR